MHPRASSPDPATLVSSEQKCQSPDIRLRKKWIWERYIHTYIYNHIYIYVYIIYIYASVYVQIYIFINIYICNVDVEFILPVCTAQGGSGSFKDRKHIGGWVL